jgi:integrase
MMISKVVLRALAVFVGSAALAFAQTAQPLQLEKTIELPDVQGRIDHMSIDVKGERLFVSALGNNTVEVIDVKAGKPVNRIHGLQQPQGVLYVPGADRLYVAWHSFRHTVSAWGKEAGLELEDVKTLLRHENIATTSNVYGDIGMLAKRRIQERLVDFVKRQAQDEDETAQRDVMWQRTPVTIQ